MGDEETPGESDLGGCEPDALGTVHQFDHAVGDGPDLIPGFI